MKKGIVYTLFSLMILTLMITYISYVQEEDTITYNFKTESNIYRGIILKYSLESVENDYYRSIEIAIKRAIIVLTNDITYNGTFDNEANKTLLDYAIYADSTSNTFRENTTIEDWAKAINILLQSKNINFNLKVNNTTLTTIEPLKLIAHLNSTLVLTDSIIPQRYRITKIYSQKIDLENFEDPYLTVKSYQNILSKFYLCNATKTTSQYEFYGISYISYSSTINPPADANKRILVTDTLAGKSGYESFKGYVVADSTELSLTNYAYNTSISAIPNNTYIVVSNNKTWITDMKENDNKKSSCYFSWSNGLSIIERFMGQNIGDKNKISTLINNSYLPIEIRNIEGIALDVESFS